MIIDRDGDVIDAVEVPDGTKTFECFRVRGIRETVNDEGLTVRKEVVGEEDFVEYPNEGQQLYCLAKHHGDFAVVEKIITAQFLPFA